MPKEIAYCTPKGKYAGDNHDGNSRGDSSSDEYECEYNMFKKSLDEDYSRVISSASKAFGLNSWSHAISKQDIDCIDCISGRYSVGAIAVVKVERNGGAYHEELGYGCCFGLKNKIVSIAIARQEAVLNALKRAVESFGENMDVDSPSEAEIKENVEPYFNMQKLNDKHSEKSVGLIPVAASSGVPQRASFSSPPLNYTPEDVKAERKRKQQQLQEEYRRRLKLKPEQGPKPSYAKGNMQRDKPQEEDEVAFISTQELDEMINCAAQTKTNPVIRAPLLSSPDKSGNCLWLNANKNCPR